MTHPVEKIEVPPPFLIFSPPVPPLNYLFPTPDYFRVGTLAYRGEGVNGVTVSPPPVHDFLNNILNIINNLTEKGGADKNSQGIKTHTKRLLIIISPPAKITPAGSG